MGPVLDDRVDLQPNMVATPDHPSFWFYALCLVERAGILTVGGVARPVGSVGRDALAEGTLPKARASRRNMDRPRRHGHPPRERHPTGVSTSPDIAVMS
jgi:hypothetical protein